MANEDSHITRMAPDFFMAGRRCRVAEKECWDFGAALERLPAENSTGWPLWRILGVKAYSDYPPAAPITGQMGRPFRNLKLASAFD